MDSLNTTVPVSETAPTANSGSPGKPIFLTMRMSSGQRSACAISAATVTPPRGSPSTITSALSRYCVSLPASCLPASLLSLKSISLSLYQQQVCDPVDTKNVPAVCLSHLSLDLALYYSIESHRVAAACDPDLRRIDERVFLQDQANGIHHLVIIVLLGRSDLDPVDHVSAPRDPPGKNPGQPLGGKAWYNAIQDHDPVVNLQVDTSIISLGGFPDQLLFSFHRGPQGARGEQVFCLERVADMVPDGSILHEAGRSNTEPVDDPRYFRESGYHLQGFFLRRDPFHLSLQGEHAFGESEMNRKTVEIDGLLTLQSSGCFRYNSVSHSSSFRLSSPFIGSHKLSCSNNMPFHGSFQVGLGCRRRQCEGRVECIQLEIIAVRSGGWA